MYDFHQAQQRVVKLFICISALGFVLGIMAHDEENKKTAHAQTISAVVPEADIQTTVTTTTSTTLFDITPYATSIASTSTVEDDEVAVELSTTTQVEQTTTTFYFSDACKYDNTNHYTINEGDTLYGIAYHYSVDIDDLVGCNRFEDGIDTLIYPGDVIILPPDFEVPTTTTTTTISRPVATTTPTTLPPVISGSGPDAARAGLLAAGATEDEIDFAIPICMRESHCTLNAINQNSRTRDDSWGPWQINYYGAMIAREGSIGPRSSNTSSWTQAAANFLKLLRAGGRCHWTPPNYCS